MLKAVANLTVENGIHPRVYHRDSLSTKATALGPQVSQQAVTTGTLKAVIMKLFRGRDNEGDTPSTFWGYQHMVLQVL